MADALKIGWAQTDLSPDGPVLIAGQFHARVSEGVMDPLTATALAMEGPQDHAVLVSCDLVGVSDELRDAVRARLAGRTDGPDPMKVVLNATHTHTGPEVRTPSPDAGHVSRELCVELPVMRPGDYVEFAADRIADAAGQAWASRKSGTIAFGVGQAVVGRNRRVVELDGTSTMYGNTDAPSFSHVEGYEDHSVNVLATHDGRAELTGLVVNVPCPSQVSENEFVLSADYWHEVRLELRRRLGDKLFVLPQCSAAGDQAPYPPFDKRAAERMLALSGRTRRREIAHRIVGAVEEVLQVLDGRTDPAAPLRHHVETLELATNALTEDDVREAAREAENWQAQYEQERRKLEADPRLRDQPRWYVPITRAYRRMLWFRGVAERFQRRRDNPCLPAELHVIRLGEMAFATNPFEYYLDFGVYIKARSKAVQTFLVQLAGAGTYVPTGRSVAGGGYGSIPASNPVGPEGGRQLADRTIEVIRQFWA